MSQHSTGMSHEQVAAAFDGWAKAGRAESMEISHGDVVAQIVAEMDIRPGQRILDLGCGNGWATRLLAQAAPGATAVGIDLSAEMIQRAEAAHTNTIRARYELAAFENLGLRDKSFDRVFSMEAIYYALDLGKALAEAARVLKPGGRIDLVIDYYEESPDTAIWSARTGLPMVRLAQSAWVAALERAGFAGVETQRRVDRRGPERGVGSAASHSVEAAHQLESIHRCGSLWLRGQRAS